MKKNSWKLAIMAVLILGTVWALTAYLGGRPKVGDDTAKIENNSQQVKGANANKIIPGKGGKSSLVADSRESAGDGEEESPAVIGRAVYEFGKIRANPTPEGLEVLVKAINSSKNEVILTEAMDALGFIALKGFEAEKAFKLLSEKAADKNFPQRGHAMLSAAILGKGQVLPLVTEYLREKYLDSEMDDQARGLAARVVSLANDPGGIPLLTQIVNETSDPNIRRNSYETLARIGTPEAVSFLRDRVQASTGMDQAAGVLALSRSDDPEAKVWIRNAIQDGTLGKEAIKTLSTSLTGPEIFEGVFSQGISTTLRADLLKELGASVTEAPLEARMKIASIVSPMVYSEDNQVKMEAIKAIGQLGAKEGADILYPFLYEQNDPELRRETFFAYIGYANPNNYKYLFDFLDDSDLKTRRMAMSLAERFVSEADRGVLEKASQSQDKYIREKATKLLSTLN